MNRLWRWLTAAVLLLIAIAGVRMALLPDAVPVETAGVETRDLEITVAEQGKTRARLPYLVTAPVNGQLLRSRLVEGDRVEAGEVIARIAVPPENPRGEVSIRSQVAAAEAREQAARATVSDTEAALRQAEREAERRQRLYEQGSISEEQRDRYRQQAERARAQLENARANLSAAQAELAAARAGLLGLDTDKTPPRQVRQVTAPASGTIYRVFERGERIIQAGTQLYLISDGDAMELVIDLLTREAVDVSPGDRIRVDGWGGDRTLQGQVKYIEPEAFTKVSALGVEEQRVNVIGELTGSQSPLGAGYRIEAEIVVEQLDSVLTVPEGALFRRDGAWHVFRSEDRSARLQRVEIGRQGEAYAQVLQGLEAGDQVIVFPSNRVAEGVAVQPESS